MTTGFYHKLGKPLTIGSERSFLVDEEFLTRWWTLAFAPSKIKLITPSVLNNHYQLCQGTDQK